VPPTSGSPPTGDARLAEEVITATVVVTVVLVPVVWPAAAAETDVVSVLPSVAPAGADTVKVTVVKEPGLSAPVFAGTVDALKFVFGVAGVSAADRVKVVAVQDALSLFVTVTV
jgi:hypothetical protein